MPTDEQTRELGEFTMQVRQVQLDRNALTRDAPAVAMRILRLAVNPEERTLSTLHSLHEAMTSIAGRIETLLQRVQALRAHSVFTWGLSDDVCEASVRSQGLLLMGMEGTLRGQRHMAQLHLTTLQGYITARAASGHMLKDLMLRQIGKR